MLHSIKAFNSPNRYIKVIENSLLWIALLIGAIALLIYIKKNFKVPKFGSLCVTTGGLKTGKSTFSLHLAYRTYKRNLRFVKIRNWFAKMLSREQEELPLFYSTIPVGFPHVRLTLDLIQRKTRFAYKSVVWIDEATLLADSQLYKDAEINAELLEFCKLFGHETKGGCLFFTSHCLSELHIAMRRASSEYFYVHSMAKWIPFFLVATVREERYSEDGTAVNVYNDDVEDSLKRVLIPKSIWKKFDCYCYSVLTDNLPVDDNVVETDDLKADFVVSFSPLHRYTKKDIKGLKKEVEEYEEENS